MKNNHRTWPPTASAPPPAGVPAPQGAGWRFAPLVALGGAALTLGLLLVLLLGLAPPSAHGAAAADPTIRVSQAPAAQVRQPGESATFTVTVTNDGAVSLTDVAVRNDEVPACARSVPDLAPGQIFGYTCSQSDLAADLVSRAVAQALADGSPVESAPSEAVVDVIAPAMVGSIQPAWVLARPGDTIAFTFTITNTGNYTLDYVGIEDESVPACALPDVQGRMLAPGERYVHTCALDGVQAGLIHMARVVGNPPVGAQIGALISSTVVVADPGVRVEKTLASPAPVARNGPVSYDIRVVNSGGSTLTGIQVSDPAADCARSFSAQLATNDFVGYRCSGQSGPVDYRTTTSVQAVLVDAPTVIATDTVILDVDVNAPQVDLAVSPATQLVDLGASAAFTITVTNTGNSTLTGLTVDARPGVCTMGTPFLLTPAASRTWTCTGATVDASFTLTATVAGASAAPFAGEAVTANAAATVTAVRFAALTGRAWHDLNGDGIRTGDEPGLPGVQMRLVDAAGAAVAGAVTDDQGRYGFGELLAGDYRVVLAADAAYRLSPAQVGDDGTDSDFDPQQGRTDALRLSAGATLDAVDAGLYRPPTLAGTVWYDANLDGVRNTHETGASGVTVRLEDGNGVVQEITTPAAGGFGLEAAPGRYRLCFGLPDPDYTFTQWGLPGGSVADPASGCTDFATLGSGQSRSAQDVGVYAFAALGGRLLDDVAIAGSQVTGGAGTAGVTVSLYRLAAGRPVFVDQTVTDGDGRFGFSGLAVGVYQVQMALPDFTGALLLDDTGGSNAIAYATEDGLFPPVALAAQSRAADMTVALTPAGARVPVFYTTPAANAVWLTWLTGNDVDVARYRMLRSADGRRESATTVALVNGRVQADTQAHLYHLHDLGALPGVAYSYWLVLEYVGGGAEERGPLSAQVDPAADVTIHPLRLPLIAR